MRPMVLAVPALLAACASLLLTSAALAQSDEGFDKGGDDAIAAKKNAAEEAKRKAEKPKDAPKDEAPDAKYDPKEDPTKAYYYVGLRFRDVIVPQAFINLFADGGATVNVAMFGPELTYRKDHVEFDFSAMYADYSTQPFLFKGKKDGDEGYEIVESGLKIFYLTLDILKDVPIDDNGRWSFLFGGGVGLGGVVGDLNRVQAYPRTGTTADPHDVNQWNKCSGPSPSPVASSGIPFCDASNTHFRINGKDYAEPSWANGGSKPFIFPWISLPQLSLRYHPIKQIQARADIGMSLSGFFFGLSAGYGL